LQLQQILFFKELGLSLKQIQTVLGRNDFDQLAALESHRQALSRDWEKMGELIKTVDSTIQHLKGQKKMNDKEMFKGFSEVTIGAGAESYFEAEVILGKSIKNPRAEKLERSQREDTIKKAHAIFRELVDCINTGVSSESDEVQRILSKHHAFVEQFHSGTAEVYRALAQLYVEHPEFRKQLDPFHPELARFMAEGMRVFADRMLS
jgi:DNA-binding transcriptional MerR regulator